MSTFPYASSLRRELSARNFHYAQKCGLPHQVSVGKQEIVCYQPSDELVQHGNFLPSTYRAILNNDNWRRRLQKPHSSAKQIFPRDGTRRKELDSCNSSDALLMNIFCYPGTLKQNLVLRILDVSPGSMPEFGYRARVPLANGRVDRTEVDMRVGHLLVEAKLTESNFQNKIKSVVEGYRDFTDVFESHALPGDASSYFSYQLIRNVLAAFASGCSFCVIMDERRPDLRERWYAVMRCIRIHDLRIRCRMLTWQELARVVPKTLQIFLHEKYGIAE
jgi:hypothetical protein